MVTIEQAIAWIKNGSERYAIIEFSGGKLTNPVSIYVCREVFQYAGGNYLRKLGDLFGATMLVWIAIDLTQSDIEQEPWKSQLYEFSDDQLSKLSVLCHASSC